MRPDVSGLHVAETGCPALCRNDDGPDAEKIRFEQSYGTPEAVIDDVKDDLEKSFEILHEGEKAAVDWFRDHLLFSSTAEASPDVASVAIASTISESMDFVAGQLGPAAQAANHLRKVATAIGGEYARAAQASGEVTLRDYIDKLANDDFKIWVNVMKYLEGDFEPSVDAQQQALPGDFNGSQGGGVATATGAKGRFLKGMREGAQLFLEQAPGTTEPYKAKLLGELTASAKLDVWVRLWYSFVWDYEFREYMYSLDGGRFFASTKAGNFKDMFAKIYGRIGNIYDLDVPVTVRLEPDYDAMDMDPHTGAGGVDWVEFEIRKRKTMCTGGDDEARAGGEYSPGRAWIYMPWSAINEVPISVLDA